MRRNVSEFLSALLPLRFLCLAAGLALPVAFCGLAWGAAGEVTFVIGQVRIVEGPGSPAALAKGGAIEPGQKIETGASGQAHIRFADGGFVVIRPDSRFRIEDYRYDPARPEATRIRFVLEEGTVRSITGKGGEAARDQFRLNTPIAAIGIKGTDFVVQAEASGLTRAAVHSGAIVFAPLGGGCEAAAQGPCRVEAARELSAAMTGTYLQLAPKQRLPDLVPADQLPWVQGAISRPAGESARMPTAAPVAPVAPVIADNSATTVTAGAAEPVIQKSYPAGIVTAPGMESVVPRIVWGRWQAWVDPAHPEASYAALMSPDRELAAGRGMFGLLRDTEFAYQLPTAGQVGFNLARSEAFLVTNGQLLPAAVTGGSLGINFDTQRFTTGLNVALPGLPSQSLSAAGLVEADGRFYSQSGSMAVSGAMTSRAAQAGYAFDGQLGANRVMGATLWVR